MHENLSAIMIEYLPDIREYLPVIKIIIAFIFGACVGSLIDALALRITAEGKPQTMACSSCCGKHESFGIIPALFHLKQPGKCQTCGIVRLDRSIFTELFSAATCALFFWRFGVSFAFILALVTFAFWLLHSLTDIENGYIYDLGIFTMVAFGILFKLCCGGIPALINGALGAATGFGAVLIVVLLTNGAMGTGDAMLMLGTGTLLGWRLTLTVLYFGFIIGGLYVIPLLITKKLRAKDSLPLAPFFALGGLASIFAGKWIYTLIGTPLLWPW